MKDSKSILMILLSAGLVSTWVYHLYDKTVYTKRYSQISAKDSADLIKSVRDSLQKIYSSNIEGPASEPDSTKNNADSLQDRQSFIKKLSEIKNLKNIISDILTKKNITKEELGIARQKITELQQKMGALKSTIEEENKKLNDELGQINNDIKTLEQNVNYSDGEDKSLTGKAGSSSLFAVSELRLEPVIVNNNKDQETDEANKVSKFVLSFTVQNNTADYSNAEILVVIIKPDGHVLQSGVWESGSFETQGGSKKNYTMKMKFESPKDEPKHLISSVDADNYQKGNYTMQVYYNGMLIGQAVKKLK